MIYILIFTYLWAGLGYSFMLKRLSPLIKPKVSDMSMKMGIAAVLIWPVFVVIFMFYDGDANASEEKS